jgi:hypothetical protein
MSIPSREVIENLRSRFRRGNRVRLDEMDDRHAPPVGTEGTVLCVDDIGSIHVEWDNGSMLAVVFGKDSCSIIK